MKHSSTLPSRDAIAMRVHERFGNTNRATCEALSSQIGVSAPALYRYLSGEQENCSLENYRALYNWYIGNEPKNTAEVAEHPAEQRARSLAAQLETYKELNEKLILELKEERLRRVECIELNLRLQHQVLPKTKHCTVPTFNIGEAKSTRRGEAVESMLSKLTKAIDQ